jgi:hypothetical protein
MVSGKGKIFHEKCEWRAGGKKSGGMPPHSKAFGAVKGGGCPGFALVLTD